MARQKDNFYLVITESSTSDSGMYMVEGTNEFGASKSYGRMAVSSSTTSADGTIINSKIVESTSKNGGNNLIMEVDDLNMASISGLYSQLPASIASASTSDFQMTQTSSGSNQVKMITHTKSGQSGQPPEFKKLFYDKFVKLGESIRLETVVVGSPKPKVCFFGFRVLEMRR